MLNKYIYDVNVNFIKIIFLNFKNIFEDKIKFKIYIKIMFGIIFKINWYCCI